MKPVAWMDDCGHIVPEYEKKESPFYFAPYHKALIERTPELKELVEAAKEWRQDSQTASRLMSAVDAFEEAEG